MIACTLGTQRDGKEVSGTPEPNWRIHVGVESFRSSSVVRRKWNKTLKLCHSSEATARVSPVAVIVCALVLSACGKDSPASSVAAKSGAGSQSEVVGSWQSGGTFPGECSDVECPAQFSFRLELKSSGDCVLKGQTRKYRVDATTAGWDYEDWHPYALTQGPCKWKPLDNWHLKMTLYRADVWSAQLNGSVLDVTSPQLQNLRIHFSRLNE
jgi:hypothetical protein